MNSYFKNEENLAMKLHYDILKDDFSRAGEASSKIKNMLRQLAIDANILRRIAIATYEAEINLVIHSMGGTIEVFIKPECVEIYIEDQGPGIENVELAMTKGYSTATNVAREMGFGAGMGLPNMEKVSDEFVIESTLNVGTNIKMVVNY
ncbi:ATP-binding protein [Fusibacter bizertensis]|jgi:Anti-sigma regulatory factor (Ser/Thr protein kinase)|uniref:ATP-binding protein n=1 Tax=Fusibacter bizertensis TaxID=1488331 RepID=A0ABT6NB90_9FIRM|nr:ATP-binding protein [Fusibacter bizertensis]MDH8677676.1 ATP-binding protein [Fusibacter bizertensis]